RVGDRAAGTWVVRAEVAGRPIAEVVPQAPATTAPATTAPAATASAPTADTAARRLVRGPAGPGAAALVGRLGLDRARRAVAHAPARGPRGSPRGRGGVPRVLAPPRVRAGGAAGDAAGTGRVGGERAHADTPALCRGPGDAARGSRRRGRT